MWLNPLEFQTNNKPKTYEFRILERTIYIFTLEYENKRSFQKCKENTTKRLSTLLDRLRCLSGYS